MENLNKPYNKYEHGKIYKITDVAYTEAYVGSTVQPLCNRMAEHRRHYLQYRKGVKGMEYRSFSLFDKYGMENCKIELIETYPCEGRDELTKREGYWIRLEEACVNKKIAGRTRKEYQVETVDIKREYDKAYREQNKDKIKQYRKEYDEEHKTSIKARRHEFYIKHKNELNAQLQCQVCGKSYTAHHKARHEKTQRHLSALENNK
jgi:hypothetical protein